MKKNKIIMMCKRVQIGESLLMADNLTGRCDTCGCTVQYRPHAPKPFILRCMACTAMLFEAGDEMYTTHRMLADYVKYLKSKKQ